MNTLKTGLMALVVLLLLVLLIDRARISAQLERVNDVEQKQLNALQDLEQKLAHGVVVTSQGGEAGSAAASASTTAPMTAAAIAAAASGTSGDSNSDALYRFPPQPTGNLDGNPKLGVNFLMPYDRSCYHPEWVGGTLHGFNIMSKSFNGILDNSSTTADISNLVNDSLCSRPETFPEQWMSGLAESAVITDDYKTYTFTLRKGVTWQRPYFDNSSDAKYQWLQKDVELTADDFKFCTDIIMDPTVDCPQLRNYYEGFDRIEIKDKYTFSIHWKNKLYTTLATSLTLSPLPKHIYAFNDNGTPIPQNQWGASFNQHWFDHAHGVTGVGPYMLERFEPDRVMTFHVNQGYWGVPLHFERIEWNLQIQKPDPKLVAFKNGQVQTSALTPLQYKGEIIDGHETRFAPPDARNPKAGRSGELGWEKVQTMGFSYIGWNMRRSPFDDVRVRQAMSYAFPKNRLIDKVFFGLGQPTLSDVPVESQYYNHDLDPYAFDLEKAKALLDAAGWLDSDGSGVRSKLIGGVKTPLHFTIKYIENSPEWTNVLNIYSNELKRIGIIMEATQEQWKELMRVYEDKDFEAVVGGWGTGWDVDFYQLWHSSQADQQGSSNTCGFKNPEFDALAEQLRQTFDTKERVAIAKKAQVILNEQQPYTFFRSSEHIFVWQNKGTPTPELHLDGVIFSLDHLNPLVNQAQRWWHFRSE